MPDAGFQGGVLKSHNHSTTPGDGGQLSSPAISGSPTASSDASAATGLVTLQQAVLIGLLGG